MFPEERVGFSEIAGVCTVYPISKTIEFVSETVGAEGNLIFLGVYLVEFRNKSVLEKKWSVWGLLGSKAYTLFWRCLEERYQFGMRNILIFVLCITTIFFARKSHQFQLWWKTFQFQFVGNLSKWRTTLESWKTRDTIYDEQEAHFCRKFSKLSNGDLFHLEFSGIRYLSRKSWW